MLESPNEVRIGRHNKRARITGEGDLPAIEGAALKAKFSYCD